MNKRLIGIAVGLILMIGATLYLTSPSDSDTFPAPPNPEIVAEPDPEPCPEFLYGIDISNLEADEGKIRRNQTVADILKPYHVSRQDIFAIDRQSGKVFSVRNFAPGKKYTLLYENDCAKKAAYFIYEPNGLEYVIYQLKDTSKIGLPLWF